ncbi:MAG TPA: histidinol dehydrogenase [Candidatus Baltobacteraceae bacterium]|nr:histidinol dehydrogenase [Candidatus Baltobacteraceae bacterium]
MTLSVIPCAERARAVGMRRDGWAPSPELVSSVAEIIVAVRVRGDGALVDFTRRYDDANYDLSKLRVPIPMHDGARALVPPEIAEALHLAKERIGRFHERQRPADLAYVDEDGTRYSLRYRALDAVAAYVHGGRVAAASAVLMSAVPAKIAGVSRTIVLCPPRPGGVVHPAVLYACSLCEVDELYAVGGAHAIAAAAYGTDSIARVNKIVGWGGAIVSEAKRQIYGVCGIDGLSGPPEVLVVADDGASSEYVAGELLAQAERDMFARVAVLSESRPLLEAVAQLLDTFDVRTLPHGETLAHVIDGACSLLHAQNRAELFDTIEAIAPERLALQVRDPEPYLARVRHVGTVLVGDMTPLASGDYLAGTNNVLPPSGMARFASGLRLDDFLRSFSVVENSRERMLADALPLAALCEFEDLPHHAQTARMRSGA